MFRMIVFRMIVDRMVPGHQILRQINMATKTARLRGSTTGNAARAGFLALPEDIIARVRGDFSEDNEIPILQMLAEYKQQQPEHPDRILRCIVFLAHGSFERFADAVKLARLDWRDLIVAAEYDG